MTKDYYKLLKLNSNATTQDIKLSYRKIAQAYHPDKTGDKRFENKLKEINEAYSFLKDENKRKDYDHQLRNYYTATNGNIILLYVFILLVVSFCIFWYLSRLSLTSI